MTDGSTVAGMSRFSRAAAGQPGAQYQCGLKKNALCYYWRFFVNSGAGGHSFSNSQCFAASRPSCRAASHPRAGEATKPAKGPRRNKSPTAVVGWATQCTSTHQSSGRCRSPPASPRWPHLSGWLTGAAFSSPAGWRLNNKRHSPQTAKAGAPANPAPGDRARLFTDAASDRTQRQSPPLSP
jgi:hypothetical protein